MRMVNRKKIKLFRGLEDSENEKCILLHVEKTRARFRNVFAHPCSMVGGAKVALLVKLVL